MALYQPFNENRPFGRRMLRPARLAALLAGLFVLLGAVSFLWSIPSREAEAPAATAEPQEELLFEDGSDVFWDGAAAESEAAAETGAEETPGAEAPRRTEGLIKKGENLAAALAAAGADENTVGNIVYNLKELVDFRKIKVGDRYRIELDHQGGLLSFELQTGPLSTYVIDNSEGLWNSFKKAVEIEERVVSIRGEVESSLYEAVAKAGEGPWVAATFADVLAWDFDFARGTQKGDRFTVLFEKRYSEGEFVGYGRVLAARYESLGEVYEAFYYDGGYYDGEGRSAKKAFLKAPLRFSRISSGYTTARMHPILKYVRPHRGVDYAAPVGAPVWSVADGKVVYAGWKGQNGKTVIIRHANGYETMYNHLSRFGRGIQRGRRVEQKDVIGYVGSTGLSTGPHLDFRLKKRGRFVNPLKEKLPRGEPVPRAKMSDFRLEKTRLLERLEG